MNVVTGGTGILGSHLLFELSRDAQALVALYRSEHRKNRVKEVFRYYDPSGWETRFQRITWVKGDILDISTLMELIQEGANVYHCAAVVSFEPRDFNRLIKVNREGTENVVNACLAKKARSLCHVSSTAAFGGTETDVVNEQTKWEKTPETTGYSISKYNAERVVWRAIEEGLNAVIVNPSVIIGPGNWDESSLTMFRAMRNGMLFYPPGSNATVDARDVAKIMVSLMDQGIYGQRFLCIGSNQSFKDLMVAISKPMGVKAPRVALPKWLAKTAQKLLAFLGFLRLIKPTMTRETVNSMYSNRAYSAAKVESVLNYRFYDLEAQVINAIKGRIR